MSFAGYLARVSLDVPLAPPTRLVLLFFGVYGGVGLAGLLLGRWAGRTALGTVSGLVCGSLGGVSMVFMKVITTRLAAFLSGQVGLDHLLGSGHVYLCFGTSLVSMVGATARLSLRAGAAPGHLLPGGADRYPCPCWRRAAR